MRDDETAAAAVDSIPEAFPAQATQRSTNRVRVLLGYFVTSVPAWMMIGFWALQQFIATYAAIATTEQTTGVAYAAHVGGFVAGVILAFILRGGRRDTGQDSLARRFG